MTNVRSLLSRRAAPLLGAIMLICGIIIAIRGAWLIAMGGSF